MTKRQILEQMKHDELIAAVKVFKLPVTDRRVRGLLIEALAWSRKAPIAEILGQLNRSRLKQICRGLGIDPSGQYKTVIIDRLVGTGSLEPPVPLPGGERTKKRRGRATAPGRTARRRRGPKS